MSATRNVKITISNTCTPTIRQGQNHWYWYLFVKIDPILVNDDLLKGVEIKLHPTFAQRLYELPQSETDPFLYESKRFRSYATFDVEVRILLQNGARHLRRDGKEKKKITVDHDLQFNEGHVHTTDHFVEVVTKLQMQSIITIQSAMRGALQRRRKACVVNSANTSNEAEHENQLDSNGKNVFDPTELPLARCTKWQIPARRWCISYKQLMDLDKRALKFFGADQYPTRTMRDICKGIIEPVCSTTKRSYAMSLNEEGLAIDVFVSHGWDGNFAAFVQSIRNAFQTVMQKPNLWICAFALVQGQNEELISQQVGSSEDPLEESPFVEAIQSAKSYCVVRNSNIDIYSRRIWCVCETIYANHYGLFPAKTYVTGPDVFAHLQSSVLDAQASRLKDRDRILKVLLTEFDREEVDNIVHQLRTQDAPEAFD